MTQYESKIEEYILQLYESKIENVQLSNASLYTLYQFGISESLSTYQVYNYLKKTNYKSEYKNVHKKVNKLFSLGFIEKVPKNFENSLHNAIYYKINSVGVFYLIKNFNTLEWNAVKILEYQGNNEFFKIFLYLFIDRKTLLQLKYSSIQSDIINYLKECCNILIQFFDILYNIGQDKGIFQPIKSWDDLHTYEKGMYEFELFTRMLNEDYNLRWIDNNVKIKKIDINTITISKNKKILFLRANDNKSEVILEYKDKILDKYELEPLEDGLWLFKSQPITIAEAIKNEKKRFLRGYQIYKLAEDLALSIIKYSQVDIELYSLEERLKDVKILARDKKFLKLLSTTESRYTNYFASFKNFIVNELK